MAEGLGMIALLSRLFSGSFSGSFSGPFSGLRPRSGLLLLVLIVGACSGGDDVPTLELQALSATREAIAAKTAPKVARPPLTRAALDTLEGAFIEIILERRDQLAYLSLSAQRRDDTPGKISLWRTEDNITLTTRNGVLIATRGLGGDILSATVQVAGDAPGPSGGGEKVFNIRALDNKTQRLALVCDLVDLGPQTIVIVERRHPTRRLQETCTGGIAGDGSGAPGEVINDYWVDSRSGVIWQSRQWAGPQTGYLRLRRLTY